MAPIQEVEQSEYLCTLQPCASSDLAQALLARRASCILAGYGVDATGLYPPHVSVTGFFTATREQASTFCELARRELEHAALRAVEARSVVATDGGHVLLDIIAPGAAEFSAALTAGAAALGVGVRPKTVRHLSLASCRGSDECAGIVALHEGLPSQGGAGWELVVSELTRRSDVEALRQEGRGHAFRDVLRLPLDAARRSAGPSKDAFLEWASPVCKLQGGEDAKDALDRVLRLGTPMKKRCWSLAGFGEFVQQVTPPKVLKAALEPDTRSVCCGK
mmetsp:Transcript_167115/g.531537  ORF Transcript_167115/g.531537 Transcript_167115/m.531537 type:complete len:277 (+) Transcript_167115:120-950(+)